MRTAAGGKTIAGIGTEFATNVLEWYKGQMQEKYPSEDQRHWSVAIADIIRDKRSRSVKIVSVVASLVLVVAASYATFMLYDSGRELLTFGQNEANKKITTQLENSRRDIDEIRKEQATLLKTITEIGKGFAHVDTVCKSKIGRHATLPSF